MSTLNVLLSMMLTVAHMQHINKGNLFKDEHTVRIGQRF